MENTIYNRKELLKHPVIRHHAYCFFTLSLQCWQGQLPANKILERHILHMPSLTKSFQNRLRSRVGGLVPCSHVPFFLMTDLNTINIREIFNVFIVFSICKMNAEFICSLVYFMGPILSHNMSRWGAEQVFWRSHLVCWYLY